MIFYVSLFFFFSFLGFCISNSKNTYSAIIFLLAIYYAYVFIFTFREGTVGSDTMGYIKNFYLTYEKYPQKMEIGFLFLNKILRLFRQPYLTLFFIVSSIIFFTSVFTYERKLLCFLMPLIYIYLIVPSFNIQRQILALSITFFALFKKNHKHSLYLLIIAFLLHKSIMLYILIYISSRFLRFSTKFYLILSILVLVGIRTGIFLDIVIELIFNTSYKGYIDFFSDTMRFSAITLFKIGMYFMFFIYSSKIEDKNQKQLLNMMIVCLIASEALAKMNDLFFRLQVLFLPVVLPCTALIGKRVKRHKKLLDACFLFILITLFFGGFCMNLKLGVNGIVPYTFVEILYQQM